MKKHIIATVVGALILFVWQFISWGLINFHSAETQYTPNQDKILEILSENLEEGQYFLPGVPPGTSMEEEDAFGDSMVGKPWALISYHPKFMMNMPMNMTRGLAIDLVAVFLLVWILLEFKNLTFGKTVMTCLAIGIIGYLTITYLNHVWFEGSTIGYLIDAIGSWGIVGVWLGWFLNR